MFKPKIKGLLLVLSGPSGVGKDTLIDRWLKLSPRAKEVITSTTRSPRPQEKNHVDYHFFTLDEHKRMADNDEFLEHKFVHGNYYGTPKKSVYDLLSDDKDAILEIDVQGALEVKSKMPEAVMIFILPPSIEELERRLRARGTETEEQIELRLTNARNEFSQLQKYDYAVVNDEIDSAASKLVAIAEAERSRVKCIIEE